MKTLLHLSGLLSLGLLGAGLLGIASSASAQTTLRVNHDTSSFENVELSTGDVGVRVSYIHYGDVEEDDENNLSYQLIYQDEEYNVVDTFAWIFAEFELLDLDSDGTDEVIVRNYSGGAHCCTNTTIHRWTEDGFAAVETGFLDGLGGDLVDLNEDGYMEIAIPHQAFLYRFGSYAESFPPVTFSTYRDGELVETTHEFPEQIREQAESMKEIFLQVREEEDYVSNSLLASYVAQQAVLNEDFEAAWEFMVDNHRREDPWGLEIYEEGEQVGVHKDFPTALRVFLMETGYLGEDGLPVGDRT
ncbi:FG-GAP repeat domain-containing protein [Leptothoe spongobia]|uniref:VCBS repeat-containing protein n=1 Tax=Leptothoe spongobia TAU-MAC 1115 TaxID=1967444 RepID=A0A947DIA8_9CYAN|nr:VCBS repeat-containing protein [Leptothoe spongobia]MBT9317477.1 VCBS repeat-containing protein [Leptothoe spongobia TAU-MAC 1115]